MIGLLYSGQWALFFLILIALVISLSFHEYGHAFAAKRFGDDTAERMGRLTLNPIAHIDPMGLMMVIFAGIGWAKPVPTDPRKFNSRWAELVVSAAGPGMNLVVAFAAVNFFGLGMELGWKFMQGEGARDFFGVLARINVVLMVFNLIPLGALDGHYMLPYVLSRKWGYYYRVYNARYGMWILLGLVALSYIGNVPIFSYVLRVGFVLLQFITIRWGWFF